MKTVNWKDYSVITTGDGYKLERWKDVILLRPDPQVIWKTEKKNSLTPLIVPLENKLGLQIITTIIKKTKEENQTWQEEKFPWTVIPLPLT